MKQALKQMRFKKLYYCSIASRCGFIRSSAWSSLAKAHTSCGAVVIADSWLPLKQVSITTYSNYLGKFQGLQKSQFVSLCRYKFCKLGPRFNEENTRHSPSFLACRACSVQSGRGRGQGERADQSVQVSTSAFVYLFTGDRLSAAFCNPDAFLRRDPIWAGVLLQMPPGRGLWWF